MSDKREKMNDIKTLDEVWISAPWIKRIDKDWW